jgi:hypothetical protein
MSQYAHEFHNALGSESWDIAPDDRVGQPLKRRRGRWLRRAVFLLVCAGLGAVHAQNPDLLPRWGAQTWNVAKPWLDRAIEVANSSMTAPNQATAAPDARTDTRIDAASLLRPPPPEPAPPEAPIKSAVQLPAAIEPEQSAPSAPAQTAEPVGLAAVAPPAKADTAPLPLPRAEAITPQQKRAEAVGLHPDLSRSLLAQMTDVDYRNAGEAIRRAIAETPDDGSFLWPVKRSGTLAQFKVHFVPGAAATCRRYVVTVAKSGWLTTALPVEKCGVRASQTAR